jgi:hypothetical protein
MMTFRDCTALTLITNLNPVPLAIETNVFDGVNQNTCTLLVFSSAVSAYQSAPMDN